MCEKSPTVICLSFTLFRRMSVAFPHICKWATRAVDTFYRRVQLTPVWAAARARRWMKGVYGCVHLVVKVCPHRSLRKKYKINQRSVFSFLTWFECLNNIFHWCDSKLWNWRKKSHNKVCFTCNCEYFTDINDLHKTEFSFSMEWSHVCGGWSLKLRPPPA